MEIHDTYKENSQPQRLDLITPFGEPLVEPPPPEGEPIGRITQAIRLIDAKFQDPNSSLARMLNNLSPEPGEQYLNGKLKRVLDLSLAVPAAIFATPIIIASAIAVKLQDGGSMFFIHNRKGPNDADLGVIKIRAMIEDAESHPDADSIPLQYAPDKDPRNTRVGAFLRRYQLEELPQLYQVVKGEMSLVGVRAATPGTFTQLENSWGKRRFAKWKKSYDKGVMGLSALLQVCRPEEKDNDIRSTFDIYYCQNATLGLDVFIIWRTLLALSHVDLDPENGLGSKAVRYEKMKNSLEAENLQAQSDLP